MIRNKILISLLLFLFSFLLVTCRRSQQEKILTENTDSSKGILFIIGGGDRDDSLMKRMLEVAHWKKGQIITAVTLSSSYGDSAFIWINDQLQRMTSQVCVKFDSAAIHDAAKLDSPRNSKIIFIGGGDQSRMMKLIEGSEVKKNIQDAYQHGALIGGTSAGAALMSEMMITGNQLLDSAYNSTFPIIRDSNLELKPGLGLLDSVIIDMHFIARSRYNRLFTAVMDFPNYQCIGIDEATAIIVQGDSATVEGESEVVVIQNPKHISKQHDHLLGASGIEVSIYLPGENFFIKK